MKPPAVEVGAELRGVLWACYEYWRNETLPCSRRSICYKWVLPLYGQRFGGRFHQSRLARLAKLGFLRPDQQSRAGHRRYYTLADPKHVCRLLEQWQMI